MKKTILILLLSLAGMACLAQKKDTSLFHLIMPADTIGWQLLGTFYSSLLTVTIGDDMVSMNYKDGKLICNKPFKAVKHAHAIIIYKNGRKIGAFTYYKKPFEFTDLHID